MRLKTLYSNNLKKVDAKFEVLIDVNVNNGVEVGKKYYQLEDYLLEVKIDSINLFTTTEQGAGKHSINIIIIMSLIYKYETCKQIEKFIVLK